MSKERTLKEEIEEQLRQVSIYPDSEDILIAREDGSDGFIITVGEYRKRLMRILDGLKTND